MRASPLRLAIVACLILQACDSAEERAETRYQRGVALLAADDPERARLEFRNALAEDAAHAAARRAYARLLRDEGDVRGAVGQYLRLVEQDDGDGLAHRELAEVAIAVGDHAAAARHAGRAFELMPEDPLAAALQATARFRDGDRAAAVAMAEAVLAREPQNTPATLVLVAGRLAAADFAGALALADVALAAAPDSEDLHLSRLTALENLGRDAEVGDQLHRMVVRFPDAPPYARALLQWHLDRGDGAAATALMRGIADATPDEPAGYLDAAELILRLSGPAAARAELERLAAGKADPEPYQRVLADLDFALGNREAGIATLRALTEGRDSAPGVRDLQVALARMLLATGQSVEAASLVDRVLELDGRHVGALKLRARRLVEGDMTERALADLNAASQEAPRDPEILTIMAEAHQREGAHDLAGQRLARALEASGFATPEALRYAGFLLQDGRLGPAESAVLDALRRAPENPDLLALLGRIHLARRDWARARQVAATLGGAGDPRAATLGADLEVAALGAEGRSADLVAMLEARAAGSGDDAGTRLALVEAHLAAGDTLAATGVAEAILADHPADLGARLALAGISARGDAADEAEARYRALIADAPDMAPAYGGLFALLDGAGRGDEAVGVLDAGIAATGRDAGLLDGKAQALIARGDFEGAITLYEELYGRDSSNIVVANNLASLLSSHRDDAESLERAFRIGRRLRGLDNPYYQDTYGWLLSRRADHEQALAYLEPAAAALSGDALTQFHLGMTQFELGRWEDARASLGRALAVAGPESGFPQMAVARARLAEIEAGSPAGALSPGPSFRPAAAVSQ